MFDATHDGHTYWQGDIFGAFTFLLDGFLGLASVSLNGTDVPKVYFASDLVYFDDGDAKPVKGYTPSPVTLIDGVNTVNMLLLDSWYITSQDPDAAYNSLFFTLGQSISSLGGLYINNVGLVPYNDSVQFTFANGTVKNINYVASVLQNLEGVVDEETAYEKFCYWADAEETNTATATSSAKSTSAPVSSSSAMSTEATSTPTATSSPTIPLFPYPVLKDSENTVAGYYLNDTGYTDVAVLQITGFEPSGGEVTTAWMDQFVDVITNFLASATWNKKKYLIIDLQGNGGGVIDLGTAAAARVFPKIAPNTKSNMVRQDAMDLIIYSSTADVASDKNVTDADEFAEGDSPFDIQYNLTPDLKHFPNVPAFLSGQKVNQTVFTQFFQTNYTDPIASQQSGFNIYSQEIANTATPFPATNIILLTDGYCASTCTVFMEHMKNQGNVQSIVIGGRPQTGPMQAVGGIKGSQVFDGNVMYSLIQQFDEPDNYEVVPKDVQTRVNSSSIWNSFDYYPLLRTVGAARAQDLSGGLSSFGVNGRNHFRIGDTTNTPLQYVYEAADCRIWYTPQILYDPIHLWKRVADIAFHNRTGSGPFTSPYCVADSTGQPTSISGGWKQGTLGPQTPPASAKSAVSAVDALGALGHTITGLGSANQILTEALNDLNNACQDYNGEKWLMSLICGWASS